MSGKDEPVSDPQHTPSRQPGWLSVIASVGAGLFGVQSSKNRERDFQAGKPADYIMVGIIAVVIFVLGLIGVVRWILADAGL
ncbi:MAG: DUF2970 domain-containing protein [Gammaproteobacteria bacterium]|nr:DUF2970 domain-containing protein [Gammaproteobacteria bacterium]